MKRVFSNHAQVCHVWAQQTQDSGRGSNIVFRGPRIYSYGDHFEMARFVDSDTVFITANKYSVSTAKHLSLVRRAVLHKTVFEVPTMDNHKENLEYFIDQARETYDKAKRARTNVTWLMGQAQDYVNNARAYMTKFHVEIPDSKRELWLALHTETYLNSDVQAALLAKEREARKAEAERIKRAEIERERVEAERLEKWLAGEDMGWARFQAMRLRVKGEEVQTSHGAQVPVIEARKLYQALKAGVDVVGQRVGYFTVNALSEAEIRIGCHTIPLAEIERIAPQIMSTQLIEA